ncbi:MAG TPA: cyclic nucleotide-binding domain-containing protein [Calditrichia bacterium]|nr:cyclic nucleotide-binding domain-containing protein [Calditrichota bacterium]HQU72314.1 cyclic nucleotide-binding domain-containing protein [Calditrichia bacterium]HQV33966.1 cyclic nucleotide-binding domain-containing protein [Calditrichia bacterium]
MFQISEVLKRVPFFQALGKDGIDFIIERLKFKPYEGGDPICEAGDPGDRMYIIISGNVKVVVVTEDGEENVVANLGSGDYFGEMALLTGEPRSASVITTEPSEMFILNKADFDVIIERFPSITLSMSKIMSQRLRETNQKVAAGHKTTPASVKGKLSEKPVHEVLRFCEDNSLNGKVVINNGAQQAVFEYERGELQSVSLGDMPEDQALDTILNWSDGDFLVEPKPIAMADLKAREAASRKAREDVSIVIVNNSMVVQKLLQRAFESMGYEVFAVETANKALKMIESMKPTLVISDTKLSDGSGIELLNSVRSLGNYPFVLLTEASNRSKLVADAAGIAHTHFTNSQEIGEVVKVVESVLS